MKRPFRHTGLNVDRFEISAMRNALNPSYKFFVMKGNGYASPVDGVYRPGSDNNDGLSWFTPFATIAKAISKANALINWSGAPWATNVEIHVAPGTYAENLTSVPYGAKVIGYGDAWDADGERGVKIKPASGSPVDVSSCVNVCWENIGFESADTSRVFDSTVLNNTQFYHCRFAGAAEATTSTAGIYTSDSVMLTVRDCRIEYVDCGIDFVYVDAGDSVTRLLVDRNFITYISEAGIRISANLVVPASLIVDNYINGGGIALAIGVDDNSGTDTIGVWGNHIDATDAIQGVTANVGGNYVGGSTIE